MKRLTKILFCTLIVFSARFSASATKKDRNDPWQFSAPQFNPLWLNTRFYPIPAVGAWVSPQAYSASEDDPCVSWNTSMTDYWANHIHYTNQRCQVVSMFQVCVGELGGQYKAIIAYDDFGTIHYIHWRGDSLPLW